MDHHWPFKLIQINFICIVLIIIDIDRILLFLCWTTGGVIIESKVGVPTKVSMKCTQWINPPFHNTVLFIYLFFFKSASRWYTNSKLRILKGFLGCPGNIKKKKFSLKTTNWREWKLNSEACEASQSFFPNAALFCIHLIHTHTHTHQW